MTSYISSFKPFIFVALLIAGIEVTVNAWGYRSDYNSNFFEFAPFREEKLQKFIIYEKLYNSGLADAPADIIQVGDSSGLFGIKPEAVEKQLDGLRYVNLGCCGDVGWVGYLDQARIAVRKNPNAKVLLLHVGPMLLPGEKKYNDWHALNSSLHDHLAGPWGVFTLPSMNYRWKISRLIEFGTFDEPEIIKTNFSEEWNKRLKHLDAERGWMPMPVPMRTEAEVQKIADQYCDYEAGATEVALLGAMRRNVLGPWLERFADFAASNKLKLAVVFGPVPCLREKIPNIDALEAEVRAFQARHPDVFIPHTMVNTYPLKDMADQIHLWPHAAGPYSQKLGTSLNQWLKGDKKAPAPYLR